MSGASLPASRGAAWLVDGFAAARRAPGAFLGACVFVGLLNALPGVSLVAGLLMPVFYAGLVQLLADAEAGAPVRASYAFAGFHRPGALGRLFPLVALQVALVVAVLALLAAAAGPQLVALGEAAKSNPQGDPKLALEVLRRVMPVLALVVPVSIYLQWMLQLAIPRAMLDGVPGGVALREAAAAVWRNLGAFAVNLLCLFALTLALLMVFAIPLVLVAAVQAVAPTLGLLLQAPVLALAVGALVAMQAVVMRCAAREVFGPAAAPGAPDTIEA